MSKPRLEVTATKTGQPVLSFFSNDIGSKPPSFSVTPDSALAADFEACGRHVLPVPKATVDTMRRHGFLVTVCLDPRAISFDDPRPLAVLVPDFYEYDPHDLKETVHA